MAKPKTVSKVLLKLELKPHCNLEYVENLFNKTRPLISLGSSIIHNLYPLRVQGEKHKDRWEYSNSEELLGVLKSYCKNNPYGTTKGIYSEITDGLLKIMHNNAEVSYHNRTLPKFNNLENVLPIRIAKFTPSWSKKSDNTQYKAYNRLGSFFLKDSKLYFKLGKSIFYVATKLSKEKFQLLVNAIHGNGISIGDPSMLVKKQTKKGIRYYLHVSVSKPKPRLSDVKSKDKIRVIGIDIGISNYLAVLSCIEYDKINNTFKIINAKGIESKQFVSILDKYEEKKSKRSSAKHKEYGVKKGLILKEENKKGESLRRDYTKQIIGYVVNKIIEYAKENKADMIAFEDLKGLYKEKGRLKNLHKTLGYLYSDIQKSGIKSLDKAIDITKKKKSRRIVRIKLDIFNELKSIKDKERLLKNILKIRNRIKRTIALLSYMPYYQLLEEVKNEALWNGILFKEINARHTSITCVRCSNIDKHNRITRSLFRCSNCHFEMHADFIASINIALKGSLFVANKVRKGSKINDIIRQVISNRQERASGRMNKHDTTSPLPSEYKNSEARGVSRLTPATTPDFHMKANDGVPAKQGQTDGLTEKHLVVGVNYNAEQRGNGG